VVEANPTVAYKVNDMFSLALGARAVYSDANVRSAGNIEAVPAGGLGGGLPATPEYTYISRDMDGDTTEYGYNLAMSVKPTDKLALAATYRSEIDLDMEGSGTLYTSSSYFNGLFPTGFYQGTGSISTPLPAVLALAVSYSFEKSTLEFVYDRTFWSAMILKIFHIQSVWATRYLQPPLMIQLSRIGMTSTPSGLDIRTCGIND